MNGIEKLGSHNSWTFAKTLHWYYPAFMARCQNLDIIKQYKTGVRLFDLRLRWDDCLGWVVAHGFVKFKTDWKRDLEYLNNRKDCYVRVILEYNRPIRKDSDITANFSDMCRYLEIIYPNIKFFGGNRKWDWRAVYDFTTPNVSLLDRYSSTTSLFNSELKLLRVIDDWWPWLYARLRNKKNIEEYKKNNSGQWLFIDYIQP